MKGSEFVRYNVAVELQSAINGVYHSLHYLREFCEAIRNFRPFFNQRRLEERGVDGRTTPHGRIQHSVEQGAQLIGLYRGLLAGCSVLLSS